MFGSRSVLIHLVRGIVGIAAIAAALSWATPHPWLALAMIPVALLALGGCPMCWVIGLVATVVNTRGGSVAGVCTTCALPGGTGNAGRGGGAPMGTDPVVKA